MTRQTAATLIGLAAVLMWSLLAVLTAASGTVPPFQLAALAFAIGAGPGLAWIAASGRWRDLRQPWPVWALGVCGLFGYHALYFTALRNAPPVEASLIAYLWPLLIVLFSALLPGERLRWFHVVGAVLGLSGTALIVARSGFAFETAYGAGYAAAAAAALTWSGYSVLSRRFAGVPSGIVAGFCLVTAALSWLMHRLLETTVWPAGLGEWLAIVGLGLFPVGAAFYVWDHGVKRGDIQVLGAASYAAPLLSTVALAAAGFAEATPKLALATLLIAGGAALASADMLRRRRAVPAT